MPVIYSFVTWCATASFVSDKGKAIWNSREAREELPDLGSPCTFAL